MNYRLSCIEWNPQHVRFNVFDRKGTHCGQLTIEATNVFAFTRNAWKGDVFWEGHLPDAAILTPEKFGYKP